MKTRPERFDEAFKLLLVVMTITFSGSIAFYKEILESKFFSGLAMMFVFTIAVWTFSTLRGGEFEYASKAIAWFFLMVTYGVALARFYLVTFLLPPLTVSVIFLASLALTLPILEYLKNVIAEKYHNFLRISFLLMTLLVIIVDVLYFLGLVTFPL